MREVSVGVYKAVRIYLLGALISTPLAAGVPASHGSTTARGVELLERGAKNLETGHYRRAVKAFEDVDRIASGGSAEALVGLSRAFNGLGDFESPAHRTPAAQLRVRRPRRRGTGAA